MKGNNTFYSDKEQTSCGRISFDTTASASSSEQFANLPKAKAADYYILGTLSSKSGRNKAITPIKYYKYKIFFIIDIKIPALYNASMF